MKNASWPLAGRPVVTSRSNADFEMLKEKRSSLALKWRSLAENDAPIRYANFETDVELELERDDGAEN